MLIFFIILNLLIFSIFFSFSFPKFSYFTKEIKKDKLLDLLYLAKLKSFTNTTCIDIKNNILTINSRVYYFKNIKANFDKICFVNGKPNLQGSIYFENIKISINYAGVFNIYHLGR